MNLPLRVAIAIAAVIALVAAWRDYPAQHCLAEAQALTVAVLGGRLRGDEAQQAVERAALRLACAAVALQDDPQWVVLRALNLMLQRDPGQAEQLLRAAIARGERAELVLNLGRALAAQGDEAGAHAAFLRAAWAAPTVTASLPQALRAELADALVVRAADLRAGSGGAVPPLP